MTMVSSTFLHGNTSQHKTRKHSSRRHTVCSRSHLPGGCLLGGGVSVQEGICLGGCLPRGCPSTMDRTMLRTVRMLLGKVKLLNTWLAEVQQFLVVKLLTSGIQFKITNRMNLSNRNRGNFVQNYEYHNHKKTLKF